MNRAGRSRRRLLHDWHRAAEFLNGGWPPWVGNVASVFQIVGPIVTLLAWWLTRTTPPRSLALLLPSRDRERFVDEVVANLADRRRWWQRLEELLSVAAAVPGLAVILRWARRRGA